jgi:hypothetical protein
MRLARAWLLALLVLVPPRAAADPAGLDAARRLAQSGATLEAARAYESALRAAGQDDPQLPVILYELAVLNEEQLGKSGEARRLFDQLIEQHPGHRLAERARGRRQALAAQGGLAGAERRYRDILDGYGRRPRAESRRLMRQLLDEDPGFAEADRAGLWLAGELLRAGEIDEARRRYRATVQAAERAGDSARLARAREAVRVFEQAQDDRRREGWRRRAAQAFLAAFVVAALLVARPWRRPRPARVPPELLYYVPVAALLVVAGWLTAGPPVGRVLLHLAGGGALVIGLAGLCSARLAEAPRPRGVRALLGSAQVLLLAVAALCLWQLAVAGSALRL